MGASEGAKFPLVLTERGVSVRIYRSEQKKPGGTYVSFWLVWHGPDGRRRRSFASLEDARTEAGRVLADVISGRAAMATITRDDAELLYAARKIAGGMNRPLLALLQELHAAETVLAGRASVLEAAKHWTRHCGKLHPRLVADASADFLAEKEAAKLSPSYVKDIRLRLGKFVATFPGQVHEIDRAAVRAWLDDSARSAVDRKKKLEVVTTFLNWCVERDHIGADTAADALRITKGSGRNSKAVEIYTPGELRRILFGCTKPKAGPIRSDLVPFVVLGAFAGIRPDGEFQRLEWADIKTAEGHIEIRAAKAKTASRRLIPINDTLGAWLAPSATKKGRVAPFKKLGQALRRRCIEVGVKFRRNALRHSYGSYRLATLKNANEVSLEMGNSPRMVFQHYRELVTPAGAAEFWSIMPAKSKVVSIAS